MIEVSCDPLTVAGFLYLLTIWLAPRAERITFQSNKNTNSAIVGCSRHVIHTMSCHLFIRGTSTSTQIRIIKDTFLHLCMLHFPNVALLDLKFSFQNKSVGLYRKMLMTSAKRSVKNRKCDMYAILYDYFQKYIIFFKNHKNFFKYQ